MSPAPLPPAPRLSVIVPLYNGLALTQAMLSSLQATLPAGLDHELILVDDGSTDGTREWLARAPDRAHLLLNERNLGFAATCNRGAASATGEFLFFLNNDLVLQPGWLEPMLAVFAQHPDAGLVGNVQRDAATGGIDHAGLTFDAKGKPAHLRRIGFGGDLRPVVAVTGACLGIRRALWQELGGFDERYVNGCEDVDLGLRAAHAGRTNYVALRSVVRHHISASPGRKLRDEQNTAHLLARWRPRILELMPRACARALVAAAWENPAPYAQSALVREALLYSAHLLPAPTARLLAAAEQALDLEAARWAHLLEGALPPVPHEIAPAWFPLRPDESPVL